VKYHVVPPSEPSDSSLFITDIISPNSVPLSEAEVVVCVGGDGTLLRTAQQPSYRELPIYGINGGTVGFLMNHLHTKDLPYLESILDLATTIQTNMMTVSIDYGKPYQVFNEVMVGGDMSTWANFSINNKEDLVGDLKGGGIIVSTAQGSTGINKNNGGAVLPITSNLWSLTGDKTDRKINHVTTPTTLDITVTSRSPISVWVDGKLVSDASYNFPLVVSVEPSDEKVTLLFSDDRGFLLKRRDGK
jgi:NAD kinase